MGKRTVLVLAILIIGVLISSVHPVQALQGCFEGPLGTTCLTSPEAFTPQKQGITCINTVPEGMESCPCVQGQPPALYDNCGPDKAIRCYCNKVATAGAGSKEAVSDSQKTGGSASTSQSTSDSHWLWRIKNWPGRFVSAFSAGWHDLSNTFFDFLPFSSKR